MRRREEALELYTAVLKVQPDNAHALMRRGLLLKTLGRYLDAAQDMQAAQAMRPHDARFNVNYHCIDAAVSIHLSRPGTERTI